MDTPRGVRQRDAQVSTIQHHDYNTTQHITTRRGAWEWMALHDLRGREEVVLAEAVRGPAYARGESHTDAAVAPHTYLNFPTGEEMSKDVERSFRRDRVL